ncbi:MAG: PAS domain S-box protein, partial [Microcoleus sp.]
MQEEPSREQLLLEVQQLRAELETLQHEKADLEILLETTTEHSDTMEAHLLGKAESALRESEDQFRAIAAATPVPVLVSRLSDGLILYANVQLAALLNLPLDELIGHHTPDFYFNPNDRPKVLEVLARDGCIQHYELQCKKADGTPFWAIISVQPLAFNGQHTALCALYDLTKRKEAEQTLLDSEKRLRRQSLALQQLGRQRNLSSGALNAAIREITETAARTLEVEKVSVWLYSHLKLGARYGIEPLWDFAGESTAKNSTAKLELEVTEFGETLTNSHLKIPNLKLTGIDLYDRTRDYHFSREEMLAQDLNWASLQIEFNTEGDKLRSENAVELLPQTQNSTTTSLCDLSLPTNRFSPAPFSHTQNSSILNVAIGLGGQIVGILSLEHIGAPREWALEERTFADSLANLVALAIEGFERQRAQEAL